VCACVCVCLCLCVCNCVCVCNSVCVGLCVCNYVCMYNSMYFLIYSLLHVAPPGPPQNFMAQAQSDTEILLTWDGLPLLDSPAYEICFNALVPDCIDGPVSITFT